MFSFTKLAAEIWRAFKTDAVPASGAHSPVKSDIRTWGAEVEDALDQLGGELVVLAADVTGSNTDTAQALLPSTADALAVESDATYRIEGEFWITRAAGTTSHTTGILFGGTAVLNSIDYTVDVANPTGNVLGTVSRIKGAAATEVVITAANTSATENLMIRLSGIVRVTTAGTLIPQFKYSTAPGGAPTIEVNSWFRATKVGEGDFAKTSGWS